MDPAPAPDLIRVRPRPFTSHISRGRSVLATAVAGTIEDRPDHGFFVHETRLLSRWRYLADDETPEPNALSPITQHRWLGYYVMPAPGVKRPEKDRGSGQVPPASQVTLELRVHRTVDGGLHEDIDLTNFTTESSSFRFAIELDADFADLTETEEGVQRGSVETNWNDADQRLTFRWTASHGAIVLARSVEIMLGNSVTRGSWAGGRISFDVELAPAARWHACLFIAAMIDGQRVEAPGACYGTEAPRDESVRIFLSEATEFETPGSSNLTSSIVATLSRARSDLAALRLFDLDREERAWTVAAGVPLYVALFGRDTLTAGWQAALAGTEIIRGTLPLLEAMQGREEEDWRDEQPGKMLHEAHSGPAAALGVNPRDRSYSSITTSGLYAFLIAELWHWTGDKALVQPYIEPALRALQWLERYGDLDGDGFYEYRSRSPMGPVNQAWKDSPDAIVHDDGREVETPIATCEEQAFVYVAKLHLAETLWWLGERDLSHRLYRSAGELKKRFNDAFWMEDEQFYALALDAQKRQVRSIASNAGHCLASAITDAARVPAIADRLFQADLFSGWGIRTLSAAHPRYNPYSYHLGSIWPVEQGTFAIGLMRYGLHDRVAQLARALFEAAALFEFHRLPELFGGHPRDEQHPFPGIYPNANSLQAWSSSSVFSLLQALLGLYPYAPLALLVIDPHLPDWLPEITLRDLRVGKARITIRFRRRGDGRTTYRILDQRGTLHVVRQATPWSLTSQPAERLRDMLASLLPRH